MPIGSPEIITLIFWGASIGGGIWLYRRIRGISEDVAAIRRLAEADAKQNKPGSKPIPPPSDGQ